MKRIYKDGAVLKVNEEELQNYLNRGWVEVDEKLKPLNAPKKDAKQLEKEVKKLKKQVADLKKENANLRKDTQEA